ncbi:MAG: hypothetical protein ACK5RL_05280 [Acidimicrobiales bacterium]
MRPVRTTLLAVVAVLVVAGGAAGWRWNPADAPPLDLTGRPESLTVTPADPTPDAGSPLRLRISGIEPPDGTVTVDIAHHAVTRREHRIGRLVADGGSAVLDIPGEATRESGHHLIVVTTDDQWGQAVVAVAPGPAVDGFLPLAGPTRITANGVSETMMMVTASDRYGNAVAAGTPFGLVVRRPDGTEEGSTGELQPGGVTGIRVPSTPQVGFVTAVVTVDGRSGETASFFQAPGPPVAWDIDVPDGELVADGRSSIDVRVTGVVDRFGNRVGDGTAVTVVAETASGRQVLTGRVIDGTATVAVRAPTAPGPVTLSTPAGGEVTGPLPVVIDATPAVATIVARWADGHESVRVGPVLDHLGAYVADGSPVTLRRGPVTIARGHLGDGYATLLMPAGVQPRSEEVTVEVLGVEGGVGP